MVEIALPVVFGGRPTDPAKTRVPYIDVDNHGGARLAAEHLLATGRRRLGTVTGPLDMPAGVDRRAGWREALTEAGVDRGAEAVGDFLVDGGVRATQELLDAHPDLDGLFVASDQMATGALQVLRARGRRVPDDVAVVGFDDFILAQTAVPPLTTIRQPMAEVGRRMAEVLVSILDGAPAPTDPEVLATEMVRRDSA